MLREAEYRERCRLRGLDVAATDRSVVLVRDLETACAGPGGTLADACLDAIEAHLAALVERGAAGEDAVMAFARYFSVLGLDALVIRLLAYLLPVGVLPAMAERLCALEGAAARDAVMDGVRVPAPGSPPEAYPGPTAAFAAALERELGRERARRVLTWNVHGIPASAFAAEREAYLAAPSIEAWLEGFHARKTAELARHAADGTLWYEQKITDAVVDFVRRAPEVLGGVRDGGRIFVTKIPYDPDRWLSETDPLARRRLACHCPLAASSISAEGAGVPAAWCACSAGYEKFVFDVVFGEETEARALESALGGSELCRYEVDIPSAVLAAKP